MSDIVFLKNREFRRNALENNGGNVATYILLSNENGEFIGERPNIVMTTKAYGETNVELTKNSNKGPELQVKLNGPNSIIN